MADAEEDQCASRSPRAHGNPGGAVRLHASAHQEEHQHDERRCRQENADRQSRGGEDQVDHDASEDDDERDHQPATEPAAVDMAEHELTVGQTPSLPGFPSSESSARDCLRKCLRQAFCVVPPNGRSPVVPGVF